MIDRATIDKIMDATNIVDVVGEFVTLRKAGVNYKGLCPFHDDKTPSFMVSPSKQICKCFACGEGGTAINFLMKRFISLVCMNRLTILAANIQKKNVKCKGNLNNLLYLCPIKINLL